MRIVMNIFCVAFLVFAGSKLLDGEAITAGILAAFGVAARVVATRLF